MVVAGAQTLRYAITNLGGLAAPVTLDAPTFRRSHWLRALHRWTANGIGFVQLREKDLDSGEIYALAEAASTFFATLPVDSPRPALLINGRPDIAVAARAAGVHLTARPGELTPAQVQELFRAASLPRPTISVSCHTLAEVRSASSGGADLLLFGPVFEKRVDGHHVADGSGVAALREACTAAGPIPVLALGGITEGSIRTCLDAGAAGVAGIRLFE